MLKVSYKNVKYTLNEKYNTIGDLQESILSKLRLNIYDINYIVFENTILGLGNLKFENSVPLDLKDLEIKEKKDDVNKLNIEITRKKYSTYIQFREDEIMAKSMQYDSYSNVNTDIVHQRYTRYPINPRNSFLTNIVNNNIPSVDIISVFLNTLLQNGNIPFEEGGGIQQTPHQIVAKEEDIDFLLKTDTYVSILPTLKPIQSECNICLETYENDSIVSIMPTCKCIYHAHCIKKWLSEESNKCPICRVKINDGIRKDLLNLENTNVDINNTRRDDHHNNLINFSNLQQHVMTHNRIDDNIDLDENYDDLPDLID
jgi:hypothetical protein